MHMAHHASGGEWAQPQNFGPMQNDWARELPGGMLFFRGAAGRFAVQGPQQGVHPMEAAWKQVGC